MPKTSEKAKIAIVGGGRNVGKVFQMQLEMLEELEQYRATGMTPEQIKEMQIDYCAKSVVLEEYKAIGTVEDLKTMKENGAFTGIELAQIAVNQMELKKYQEIGTVEQCREAVEQICGKVVRINESL